MLSRDSHLQPVRVPQNRLAPVFPFLCLAGGWLLAGCTQTELSKPAAITRAAPPAGNPAPPAKWTGNVPVEPATPYPLWLPIPGPSETAELPPRAETARRKGLEAASRGDWPAAVAAFKEALQFAHAAPSLMFNLALALQQGGWPMPAAVWYRAYVSAMPEAANAEAVRSEIRKLVSQTEDRVFALLTEAEGLADKLSATPAAVAAMSLRQAALEDIASYAYTVGLAERGDHLLQKAAALPGAVASTRTYDKRGLYGAYYARDRGRVDDIVTRFGREYDEKALTYRIYTHWLTGNIDEARRLVATSPSFKTYSRTTGSDTRAYDLMATIHERVFASPSGGFDSTWVAKALIPGLESAYWDGRPDVAARLATQAVAHYRKYQLDFYRTGFPRITNSFESDGTATRRPYSGDPPSWDYIVPLAALGDRPAIEQEMRRWPNGYSHGLDFGEGVGTDSASLLLATSLPPNEAIAIIEKLVRWRHAPSTPGDSGVAEFSWPVLSPLSYFALSVLKGDPDQALRYLRIGIPGLDTAENPYWQEPIVRALRFAVATNRPNLALQLAAHVARSRDALLALNRLALNHPGDIALRERVNEFSDAISGGWRPKDADQARQVWRWIDHGPSLDDEQQYTPLPEDLDDVAKKSPEKLPAHLAGHAAVLWMAVLAVQAPD